MKFVRIMLFSAILSFVSVSVSVFAGDVGVGMGVGVPYGGLGIAAEYDMQITNGVSLAPTVGIGSTVKAGAGYDIGAQMFFGDKNSTFRFGSGVWYGSNAIIEGVKNYEVGHGITVGLTPRLQFGDQKNHAFNLHLLYRASTSYDNPCNGVAAGVTCRVDEGSRIDGGIGYLYKF